MRKVVLLILDGFGCREDERGNAVAAAKKDNFDRLWRQYPSTKIHASGKYVGLPAGQMGNSEVGHLNIGAGRIVYQDLVRINQSIESGEIRENEEILQFFAHVKEKKQALHLFGLLSDGGVHSHQDHLEALLDFAKESGLEKVYVHAFLDGRDVPPRSAGENLARLEEKLKELSYPAIASIMGRYYAMDRDQRWERVQLAYDAMVMGQGLEAKSALEALQAAYARGEDDEFVQPTIIVNDDQAFLPIGKEEALFCFNFRADRVRQLTRAFTEEDFTGFSVEKLKPTYLCLTEYDEKFTLPVAYKPLSYENTLGQYLAKLGKKQLRLAETEKYAHVTFFFNGGVERENEGEDRILVPSPKVATYDLQPEMSAAQVAQELLQAIESEEYDFILVNFANADMVGHTGIMEAAIKAIETVDVCLGQAYEAAMQKEMILMVTADHGNAELMLDVETNKPLTAHTNNPVPLIIAGAGDLDLRSDGILGDLAPTILELMDKEIPEEMTGKSIIKK